MRSAAALFIVTLAVASADAAEGTPAAQSAEDCATHAMPTAATKPAEAKGRMPVRGLDHFAAIYGRSPAPAEESTANANADAGDQTAALARAGSSRS